MARPEGTGLHTLECITVLTEGGEKRLSVFENMVLRKIFGPYRDVVSGELWQLHREELYLCVSYHILTG